MHITTEGLGSEFAPDGVMGSAEACRALGISKPQLLEWITRGRVAARRDPETGRLKICRRSVREYLDNLTEIGDGHFPNLTREGRR